MTLPKTKEEPELRQGLELYFDAFWDLDLERNHGAGWCYIPWRSIIGWAEHYELDEDQTYRLVAHIKAMDNANISKLAADAKAKEGK